MANTGGHRLEIAGQAGEDPELSDPAWQTTTEQVSVERLPFLQQAALQLGGSQAAVLAREGGSYYTADGREIQVSAGFVGIEIGFSTSAFPGGLDRLDQEAKRLQEAAASTSA